MKANPSGLELYTDDDDAVNGPEGWPGTSELDSQSQLGSMATGVEATDVLKEHVEEKQRISRGIAPVEGLNFIEASTSYTSPSILLKKVQS